MSAPGRAALAAAFLLTGMVACDGAAGRPGGPSGRFGLGQPATAQLIAAWDVDVDTLGHGLPPGSGTAATGAVVFAQRCALCHGANGEGMAPAYPRLIGRDPRVGFPFGRDPSLVATIGNYWPYATTLYDYVRRAMPFTAPGSLTPDETYGVVAYLLARNEIISGTAVMDARTLPAVRMPAHGRFVRDDRRGGPEFR